RSLVRELPLQSGTSSQGAFSVAWHGERCVVVGGDYQDPPTGVGSAAVSMDGGLSFAAADAGGFRSAVIWVDASLLLAVGSHGASWSNDGGQSWAPFGELGFHSLSLGRDGSIWASGSDGRVARLLLRDGSL